MLETIYTLPMWILKNYLLFIFQIMLYLYKMDDTNFYIDHIILMVLINLYHYIYIIINNY